MMWAKVGKVAPVRSVEAVYRDFGRGSEVVDQQQEDTGTANASPPPFDRRSAASIVGRDRMTPSGLPGGYGQGPGAAGMAALEAGAKDAGALRLDREAGAAALGSARSATDGLDANGRPKPTRNQIEDRLARLEGEKGAEQRKQTSAAQGKNAEQAAVIAQLKARDSDVKAHEAAHIAAGGSYITGGASYSYQRGPDGTNYAIGGEVGIDSSPIPGKPEETIAKMQIVRAAALAPADPSGADLSVAGAAAEAMAQAMAEVASAQSAPAAATQPGGATQPGAAAQPGGATQPGAAAQPAAAKDPRALPGSKIDLVA